MDYSPRTFLDTKNTLASFRPSGLTHEVLNSAQIGEFQAERLLEAGYVIVHDEAAAALILEGRKS
jgi:hypothetical protein